MLPVVNSACLEPTEIMFSYIQQKKIHLKHNEIFRIRIGNSELSVPQKAATFFSRRKDVPTPCCINVRCQFASKKQSEHWNGRLLVRSFPTCLCLATVRESIEWLIEDQAFLQSYDLAPLPPLLPFPPFPFNKLCLFFSVFLWVAVPSLPNHKTVRKSGLL